MKIKIYEKYKGELREKKEDLIKSLFPNVKSVEEELKVPLREMKEPAAQDILDKLDKQYKKMLSDMFDEIENVLIQGRDK